MESTLMCVVLTRCNLFLSEPQAHPRSSPSPGSGMKSVIRLLYAIAKIAFITARIIASLDFMSPVQYMIPFIYHFIR